MFHLLCRQCAVGVVCKQVIDIRMCEAFGRCTHGLQCQLPKRDGAESLKRHANWFSSSWFTHQQKCAAAARCQAFFGSLQLATTSCTFPPEVSRLKLTAFLWTSTPLHKHSITLQDVSNACHPSLPCRMSPVPGMRHW